MKRLVAFVLVCMLALGGSALAEDLGVQIIGGDASTAESLSLDDVQLETGYEVDGYATITPKAFEYKDAFLSYIQGYDHSLYDGTWTTDREGGWVSETDSNHNIEFDGKYWSEKQVLLNDSKTQADFAVLSVDVLNTTGAAISYLEKASVKVFYNDVEFNGWCRQLDYDISSSRPLHPDSNFAIDPYYTGHYYFGCTLPNAVVEGEDPLYMVITIGDNELTYYIRK